MWVICIISYILGYNSIINVVCAFLQLYLGVLDKLVRHLKGAS